MSHDNYSFCINFFESGSYRMIGNFHGVQISVDFVLSAYPQILAVELSD